MTRRFLSLGSNVEPGRHMPACIESLRKHFKVVSVSKIYETDPVGAAGNSKFWNGAVEIESDLSPSGLTGELRKIEASLGRKRNPADKFAPRTIDIDVLPQAGYQDQAFIMVPLAEIAPAVKDAETGKTFRELAEKFGEEKKKFREVRV